VFSNNGHGLLSGRRALGADADRTYGIALGDVDGDGALDVVVANERSDRSPVYRNDGKGNFARLGFLSDAPSHQRRALALGDLDKDGDVDAVLVGLGQDHIYMNDGGGRRWVERALGSREGSSVRAVAVALADLDDDGDLDIVVPNRYRGQSLIYMNDGRGGFAETRQLGSGTEDMTSVAIGDLDGDRDPDIVVSNREQPHVVYLNDGRGNFKQHGTFGSGREQTWTVALGDMDLDGDLDVVVGNVNISFWNADLDGDGRDELLGREARNEPSRVYVNDGTGRLTPGSPFSTGSDETRPIALGDLDRDGDLDIVMGNICQTNHIFFNSLRDPKSR
jgi:hypothetical protein